MNTKRYLILGCEIYLMKYGCKNKRQKLEKLIISQTPSGILWISSEEFQARKEHGFPVKWLEADEIKKKFGLEDTNGGILYKQGSSINAFRLSLGILANKIGRIL